MIETIFKNEKDFIFLFKSENDILLIFLNGMNEYLSKLSSSSVKDLSFPMALARSLMQISLTSVWNPYRLISTIHHAKFIFRLLRLLILERLYARFCTLASPMPQFKWAALIRVKE